MTSYMTLIGKNDFLNIYSNNICLLKFLCAHYSEKNKSYEEFFSLTCFSDKNMLHSKLIKMKSDLI